LYNPNTLLVGTHYPLVGPALIIEDRVKFVQLQLNQNSLVLLFIAYTSVYSMAPPTLAVFATNPVRLAEKQSGRVTLRKRTGISPRLLKMKV
jgi:hypothetical protein